MHFRSVDTPIDTVLILNVDIASLVPHFVNIRMHLSDIIPNFVCLQSAVELVEFVRFLRLLAEGPGPVVVHCR